MLPAASADHVEAEPGGQPGDGPIRAAAPALPVPVRAVVLGYRPHVRGSGRVNVDDRVHHFPRFPVTDPLSMSLGNEPPPHGAQPDGVGNILGGDVYYLRFFFFAPVTSFHVIPR